MNYDTFPGTPYPLGANTYLGGVNFSVYSENCQSVELIFFDNADDDKPSDVFKLDPKKNKTFNYWHIFIPRVKTGQLYAYRVYGKYKPDKGFYYDGTKVLLDPYSKAVARGEFYNRESAIKPGTNCRDSMKSVVVNPAEYDWEGDKILGNGREASVIYEMHVGGFTKGKDSGVNSDKKGTFLGLTEKIPYLQELGVTAVELLPVQQFDPQDAPNGLINYWGYSPIAFFAPHQGYARSEHPLAPVYEFREMVKAFHKAGIEVILDVVFNHTAEGGQGGPLLSFKGFENNAYYITTGKKREYANYSGCGNTLNSNHSVVKRMILDCLRYWTAEMHVDGFRFDLASVMSRDEKGRVLESPPILWEIESDPVLAGSRIIAEAWDAAGLFQVGNFIGNRWAEWNSHFRDDVRHFVKGDNGVVRDLAMRITGSLDLYRDPKRNPKRNINFVTCHDGFTINDLVSYNEKHNEANKENNRDGSDNNISWNHGAEGKTDDKKILELRNRQIKNFLTILFLSQGTPMMLMGDEVKRTQNGNNNTYCQDNELGWYNWNDFSDNKELFVFTKNLIGFIKSRDVFNEDISWLVHSADRTPYIKLSGVKLGKPDFSYHSHTLAYTLSYPFTQSQIHVILNAFWEELEFEIPFIPANQKWAKIVDTSKSAPYDFRQPEDAEKTDARSLIVPPRTSIVLENYKL